MSFTAATPLCYWTHHLPKQYPHTQHTRMRTQQLLYTITLLQGAQHMLGNHKNKKHEQKKKKQNIVSTFLSMVISSNYQLEII